MGSIGSKVLALLVALLLWLQVASTVEVEEVVELPLTIVELPDSLVVREAAIPQHAKVRIRGSKLQLLMRDLFKRDLGSVRVPMADASAGLTRINLDADLVAISATALDVITPQELLFRVHRKATRRVPVRVAMDGQLPPEDIVAGRPELSPYEVDVSGPKALVDALVHINTQPLDLSKRRQSFRERLALASPDPDLELRPREVEVAVGIDRIIERTFTDVLISVLSDIGNDRIHISPTTAQVRVSGAQAVVEAMGPADVSVVLHIGELEAGSYELPAEIVVPDGTASTSVEPLVFHVIIDPAPR